MNVYEYIDFSAFDPEIVEFGFLDERYDKKNANITAFKKLPVYIRMQNSGFSLWGIKNFSKDPRYIAQNIDDRLKKYVEEGYQITALMGMGPDGHTAGIMPYPEDTKFFRQTFMDKDVFAVYYDAAKKNEFRYRITTTISFLENIDIAFAYITGIAKKQKLKQAMSGNSTMHSIPFSVIKKMKNVRVYADFSLS